MSYSSSFDFSASLCFGLELPGGHFLSNVRKGIIFIEASPRTDSKMGRPSSYACRRALLQSPQASNNGRAVNTVQGPAESSETDELESEYEERGLEHQMHPCNEELQKERETSRLLEQQLQGIKTKLLKTQSQLEDTSEQLAAAHTDKEKLEKACEELSAELVSFEEKLKIVQKDSETAIMELKKRNAIELKEAQSQIEQQTQQLAACNRGLKELELDKEDLLAKLVNAKTEQEQLIKRKEKIIKDLKDELQESERSFRKHINNLEENKRLIELRLKEQKQLEDQLLREKANCNQLLERHFQHDPNFSNLNDPNRKDVTLRNYEGLESGGRLEALDHLVDELGMSEADSLQKICKVLEICYNVSSSSAVSQLRNIQELTGISKGFQLVENEIKLLWKAKGVGSVFDDLLEKCLSELQKHSILPLDPELQKFVKECLPITWVMQLQNPKLELLIVEPRVQYKKAEHVLYPSYTNCDEQTVKFTYWPGVISGGRVQLKPKVYI